MAIDTRVDGEFEYSGLTWKWRWLDDMRMRLSVLQYKAIQDADGIDQTPWPSDAVISRHVGATVRFFDAGDHPEASEAIFYTPSPS
jgi:hypothetical protein